MQQKMHSDAYKLVRRTVRNVLPLHEKFANDIKKVKPVVCQLSQQSELIYEGRQTVWGAHATFEIFIACHANVMPSIVEIVVFHPGNFTFANRLYIPLPSVFQHLSSNDLQNRIRVKEEKYRRQNVEFTNESVTRKCTNKLISQFLISNLQILSNNSSLLHNNKVTAQINCSDDITCDKPDDLVPIEIVPRRESRAGRSTSSPANTRRVITSPLAMVKSPSCGIGMNSHASTPMSRIFEEQDMDKSNIKEWKFDHLPNKVKLVQLNENNTIMSSHSHPSRVLTASSVLEESAIESDCARKIKQLKLPSCAISQLLELPPVIKQDFIHSKTFDHRHHCRRQRKQPSTIHHGHHHLQPIIPSLIESYQQFAVDNSSSAIPHFNWSKGRIHHLPRLLSHQKKDNMYVD